MNTIYSDFFIQKIKNQLKRINFGECSLKHLTETDPVWDVPDGVPFSGVHQWEDDDGWIWGVFVDCGNWDYLDHVITSEGRCWKKLGICKAEELGLGEDIITDLGIERPDDEIAHKIWGLVEQNTK